MDPKQAADYGIDVLDALADKWFEECGLTAMIKNVTSPMNLNRSVPPEVREKFKSRMESQMSAIVLQAFVEGALRGVDLVNDEIKELRALGKDLNRPQTT